MTADIPALFDILVGFSIGVAVGLLFFGGLWWTTQRVVASPCPARLMLFSFAARMSVLGFGMYGASRFGAAAVVTAGVGLLVVRQLMVTHVQSGTARAS